MRMIYIISDGVNDQSATADRIASELKASGVQIHAMVLGKDRRGQQFLDKLTSKPRQQHFVIFKTTEPMESLSNWLIQTLCIKGRLFTYISSKDSFYSRFKTRRSLLITINFQRVLRIMKLEQSALEKRIALEIFMKERTSTTLTWVDVSEYLRRRLISVVSYYYRPIARLLNNFVPNLGPDDKYPANNLMCVTL